MTGMLLTLESIAATNPNRLVEMLHTLAMVNPETARYVEAMTALTPEALGADTTLSERDKARAYDSLFEWGGFGRPITTGDKTMKCKLILQLDKTDTVEIDVDEIVMSQSLDEDGEFAVTVPKFPGHGWFIRDLGPDDAAWRVPVMFHWNASTVIPSSMMTYLKKRQS